VPAAARDQVMQIMDSVLTREQLEASLASDWDSNFGAWDRAEMDEGDLYEITSNRAVPAFGNIEVPMRSTFLFNGRVSCNGRDTSKHCVELETRTYVDPAGLATAIQAFQARPPAGQQAPRILDMQQETVVRLISEPDTLLPHFSRLFTSTRSVA
jgi:hypothetical protein